jgi:glucose/arabinose dehydrogenase
LNWLNEPGASFFGFPWCWTEGPAPGDAGTPGLQHADLSLSLTQHRDDVFCRDRSQVHPPALALPAHGAPLGVVQYTGTLFPPAWRGALRVTSHGSSYRDVPVGRLAARIDLAADGPATGFAPVFGESDGARG